MTPVDGSPARRVSHAQNGEDVRAWRALRDVDEVFYVEVGASDPVIDSLTAALSAEGARGVLFEADPVAAQLLREARPRDIVVAAAASCTAGVLTFHEFDRRGWGSVAEDRVASAQEHVVRSLTVPAVRVADVLTDLRVERVHFMSVDVEGHEEAVLAGAGLAEHRPWILCVEATAPNSRTPTWQAWEPGVLAAGYVYVAFDGLNRWYVAEEHQNRAAAVSEPFGVLDRLLDGWVPAELVASESRQRHLEVELESARSRVQELEVARARVQELEAALSRATANELAEQARARVAMGEQARAEASLTAAEVREQELTAALAAAKVEHYRFTTSRSWRYTRPVRELVFALGSRRRALPGRSRAAFVRVADRALAGHPEARATVIHRLSRVPGLADRVRGWQNPPAVSGDGPSAVAGPLHETANARLVTSAAALLDRFGHVAGNT